MLDRDVRIKSVKTDVYLRNERRHACPESRKVQCTLFLLMEVEATSCLLRVRYRRKRKIFSGTTSDRRYVLYVRTYVCISITMMLAARKGIRQNSGILRRTTHVTLRWFGFSPVSFDIDGTVALQLLCTIHDPLLSYACSRLVSAKCDMARDRVEFSF